MLMLWGTSTRKYRQKSSMKINHKAVGTSYMAGTRSGIPTHPVASGFASPSGSGLGPQHALRLPVGAGFGNATCPTVSKACTHDEARTRAARWSMLAIPEPTLGPPRVLSQLCHCACMGGKACRVHLLLRFPYPSSHLHI
jgi:hypothetical protein